MGYLTKYRMHVEVGAAPNSKEQRRADNAIIDRLETNRSDENDFFLEVFNTCSTKWYDHEEDTKAFSTRFPEFVFKLEGEGEASGDLWHKYFHNGTMQICRGEIVYPRFDAKKLK